MPFHAISSGIFQSLEWRFSKFANCSGIFQSLQKLKWHFSKFGNCSAIFMNRHNWSGIYLICFLRRKQGVNWAVRDTLACLDSLFFYIYHRTAQQFFFLFENGQPSFFVICQVSHFIRPLGQTRRVSFGWPRKWPISNEKWVVHF